MRRENSPETSHGSNRNARARSMFFSGESFICVGGFVRKELPGCAQSTPDLSLNHQSEAGGRGP